MIPNFQGRGFLSERLFLASILLTLAMLLVYTDWLWRWNQLFYDCSLRLWSRPAPQDIIIVAIDEHSLAALGRWPWPRRLHATLIDRLTEAGARVIGLDIILAEPDLSDPLSDVVLAKAIRESGRVILPVFPERLNGQLLETLPIATLAESAAGLGHIDIELDQDGIVRSTYLKAGLGSPHWPGLALAMLELANSGIRRPLPGERLISNNPSSPYAWVRDYRIGIPFAGAPGHFAQISYWNVLNRDFPEGLFRDKFVLVGATAAGLAEALATPLSASGQPMSGVEVNANILNALRQGLIIRPLSFGYLLGLSGILVLLPAVFYPSLAPRDALLATVLLLLLTAASSLLLLSIVQLWFAPAAALLALILSYPLWSWRRLERTVRALYEEKERMRVILDSIGSAVITTDTRGLVEYMNPMAEELTGYRTEEGQGRPLDTINRVTDEEGHNRIAYLLRICLQYAQRIDFADCSRLINRSGEEHAVRGSIAPIRNQAGKIAGLVLAISDITEATRMAHQITRQTNYDTVTHLPNRTLLRDRLNHAITRAERGGQRVAVLFIDLDDFKKVNDSLGHVAGDRLLQTVACRLSDCVRQEDTVARLGGDEFVILLEDLSHETLATLVARKIIEAFKPSFLLENHELFITASIGISLFPKDGPDEQTLLKNADTALYRAKEQGRNTFQFYTAEMNARALERLNLENDLRYAQERGELLLYYQPQVDLENGRIIGVEALLRWQHPQRGIVPPGEFIPLAEETGLILPIGEWVLRTACSQAKAWQSQGLAALRIAVNLSARQFMQSDLTGLVGQALSDSGLEASRLELEITESLLMKNVETAIVTLRALKAMGVQLAIDDFGTGYSSLNYLKRFPLDRLKIDRSFVHDITTDPDDAAIALAVIAMAHSMKLRVIAEGVETNAQLDFLRSKACNEIQGFYFSRPLPAEEAATLLRRRGTLW